MLTLTLPPGARGSTPTESRTAASRLWNAYKTWLRGRPPRKDGTGGRPCYLGDYIVVPEAHEDGTCHLHAAVNLESMVAAHDGDLRAVQAALQVGWSRLGGGWIWYGRGRARRGRTGASSAAAYLSKYLGKSQAKPTPWDDARYCTVDTGFRARPWHRFWPSRRAGAIIAGPAPEPSGYELGHLAMRPNGELAGFELWNPAEGSAIVLTCDGHDVKAEWIPGECHHGLVPGGLRVCFCVPPWASELPWADVPRERGAWNPWVIARMEPAQVEAIFAELGPDYESPSPGERRYEIGVGPVWRWEGGG